MTLLIPDARRRLLTGLIDDAVLLDDAPPSLEEAVAAHRALRSGDDGWMVGRFVVPAALLERLAAVLVGTMAHGERPWHLAVVIGSATASDASVAASFHAAMDPAATIEIVLLPPADGHAPEAARRAFIAGGGIQPEALSLLTIGVADEPGSLIDAVGRAGTQLLRPTGVCLSGADHDAPDAMAAAIARCERAGVPFSMGHATVPAVTTIDPESGVIHYGALNILAASLSVLRAGIDDPTELLIDDEPDAFELGFSGMTWRATPVGPGSVPGPGGGSLISIAAHDPSGTVGEIARFVR